MAACCMATGCSERVSEEALLTCLGSVSEGERKLVYASQSHLPFPVFLRPV